MPQQYVPLPEGTEMTVGQVAEVRPDPMVDKLTTRAIQLNKENITKRRQEMAMHGAMAAASGEGVERLRQEEPWYANVFGGDAHMAGAVNFTVQKTMIEYKAAIKANAAEYRQLSPKAFAFNQESLINSMATGDEETDTAIRRKFLSILPGLAANHGAEHAKYLQEVNLQKYSSLVNTAIANYDPADGETAVDLQSVLQKPADMHQSAWEDLMFETAGVAADQGSSLISSILYEQGLVNTPERATKLEKAHTKYVKAKAEQDVQAFSQEFEAFKGEVEAGMELPDILNTFSEMRGKYGDSFDTLTTGSMFREIFSAQKVHIKKKTEEANLARDTELYGAGLGSGLSPKTVKQIHANTNTALSRAAGNPAQYKELLQGLYRGQQSSGVPNKELANRIKGSLYIPLVEDAEGNTVLTTPAVQVLAEMDAMYEFSNGTDLLTDTLDTESVALYAMYRQAREAAPDAPQASLLQQAVQYREKVSKVDPRALRDKVRPLGEDIRENNGWEDLSILALADMNDALGRYAVVYDNDAAAQSATTAYMKQKYDIIDGQAYQKVQGKSLAQRVGVADPIEQARKFLHVQHRETPTGDFQILPNGSKDSFLVINTGSGNGAKVDKERLDADAADFSAPPTYTRGAHPVHSIEADVQRQAELAGMTDREKITMYKLAQLEDKRSGGLFAGIRTLMTDLFGGEGALPTNLSEDEAKTRVAKVLTGGAPQDETITPTDIRRTEDVIAGVQDVADAAWDNDMNEAMDADAALAARDGEYVLTKEEQTERREEAISPAFVDHMQLTEGFEPHVYPDSGGFSIGYGMRVYPTWGDKNWLPEVKALMRTTSFNPETDWNDESYTPDPKIFNPQTSRPALTSILQAKAEGLQARYPNMPKEAIQILSEFQYQAGSGWTRSNAELDRGNLWGAAQEMAADKDDRTKLNKYVTDADTRERGRYLTMMLFRLADPTGEFNEHSLIPYDDTTVDANLHGTAKKFWTKRK